MYTIDRKADDSVEFYHNIPSGIVVNVQLSQPDAEFHMHDFLEICIILSGKISHTINGITSILEKGDFFIVDFGISHKFTKLRDIDCRLINILFRPSVVDYTLSDRSPVREVLASQAIGFSLNAEDNIQIEKAYHDATGIIEALALDMKKESSEMSFGYEQKLKCDLISLLIHVARQVHPSLASDSSSISYNIVSYIKQHYNERLTLESIGKKFHMNPAYLCTKLKKETGSSFVEYLQKTRVANACRLLSLTDMRISEICTAVGYDDIKHFEKIFRKYTFDSPTSYRKISKQILKNSRENSANAAKNDIR